MTLISNGIEELRGQRPGVCHRCGWSGMVGAVHGRDRKILKTGYRYSRLCQECVIDIVHALPEFRPTHPVVPVKVDQATTKAGRTRQVA
jgi:hypothetical protein